MYICKWLPRRIKTLFMGLLLTVLGVTPPSRALMISEIMYNPADDTLEFIELYNNRAVFEDLSGYTFTKGIEYAFDPGTILGAKEFLVVALEPNVIREIYGIPRVYGPYMGKLSNSGERIELASEVGETVISLRYNDAHPWPVAPDGTGHSLVRLRFAGDPEEATTWAASMFIGGSPGAADVVQTESGDSTQVSLIEVGHPGRYFKGTREPSPGPGGLATTDWTQIDFTDDPASTAWIAGDSGYGYSSSATELAPVRTVLNDMRGNYMSVYARLRFDLGDEQVQAISQLIAEVYYDDDFVLYLNGTRVGDSGRLPGDPPAFDQGRGGGSEYEPASVDLNEYTHLLVPGTNVLAAQVHNATLSNSSDGLVSPILRAVIEKAVQNDNPEAVVLINEILANSDAGNGTDWIELYNPGPHPIDLAGLYLSDDADDLLQYRIPEGIHLQPGELWAVSEGMESGMLPFALNASGETVFLTVATDEPEPMALRVLDAIRYGDVPADVSFGRSPDGAARLGLLGTPSYGMPNAQARIGDIVINEIMYHHGTRDDGYEYIELYNRSDQSVSLEGWAFTDGIDYTFAPGTVIGPNGYLVIAKDPDRLETTYDNLTTGANLVGPFQGSLNDHSERIRLSYPVTETDPETGDRRHRTMTADEVRYYDGGRWPVWADGRGASLELSDPHSDNSTADAWAASDESAKAAWEPFSFTVNAGDSRYTHDQVTVFDMMMLHQGEVLLDDVQLKINGTNRLDNGGFESSVRSWRLLGNHVQSYVTTDDAYRGTHSLRVIATGHGDPGANRINQSISSTSGGTVTFQGRARWLRGSRYLLLRTTRDKSPVQPPRPAHAFELTMPLNQGTPGQQNTCYTPNRGPDILEVRHDPVMPSAGQPITVSARVLDPDGVDSVFLAYRSEGQGSFTHIPMADDGMGKDQVAADGLYVGTIPGANRGTLRSFYIQAFDGFATNRFPTRLEPSADVPERTCLVRVGDAAIATEFATYRIWMANDVVDTFRSRPNLSNELLDCTFVYNDSEVFYNCRIRHRGSPFLRSGFGQSPVPGSRNGYRIDFNSDQRFGDREEINLDGMEGGSRGPLQERASHWFYRKMGLQHARQEYVRPILNGSAGFYEDVRKIDADYVRAWFPLDANGTIHKIDDYFEYSSDGTGHRNLDEGLKSDSRHPLIPETYRWGFEKRSHPNNDNWEHLFHFAVAMNTSSKSRSYEEAIESVIHPEHFATVLAIRHAVGDWDSYGYNRGKNNYFYYASKEGKWYLLPWDIDFTLGSGSNATSSLFSVNAGQFPEVQQFFNYPKYREMYLYAFSDLVQGPWQTSYGTGNPPTEFDRFLDDAANALIADGQGSGRRDAIKQFVRDRRAFILPQVPIVDFEITTHDGQPWMTTDTRTTLEGKAPSGVAGMTVNGLPVTVTFSGKSGFSFDIDLSEGLNMFTVQGVDSAGEALADAVDFITVIRTIPCTLNSITPNPVVNTGMVELTFIGSRYIPGAPTSVVFTRADNEPGIRATEVVALDEQTLTCQVDFAGATPGLWAVTITPTGGYVAPCHQLDALLVQ